MKKNHDGRIADPAALAAKKEKRRAALTLFLDYVLCAVGTLLYSIGVVCFINPMKFVPGGVTTLGILVNHLLPVVPIGAFVFLVNVPLFIVSFRKFGVSFISKTVVSTALLSLFIEELGNNTVKFGFKEGKDYSLDIRVVHMEDGWIMRLRDNCPMFDVERYIAHQIHACCHRRYDCVDMDCKYLHEEAQRC